MRFKHRLALMLSAASLLTGSAVVTAAQPASASSLITSISVVVTTDMCPKGGSVHRTNATITQPGTSGSSGGDTVSGLSAFAGNRSEIQGSNFCQTSWFGSGYYWYWDVYRYLYNNGQTTYV